MTPQQFTRVKYQLKLMVADAKAHDRREVRVNRNDLAALKRSYRDHFSTDPAGDLWLEGVKLVST